MSQPHGFKDKANLDFVCKLHKSLYGLKQAPRAWFEKFTTHFLTLGFTASLFDSSLFVHAHNGSFTYPLLYVDNIIITDSDFAYIDELKHSLGIEFQITYLDLLKYFLGIQIQYCTGGIHVSQAKYLSDILLKVGLLDAKPYDTPMFFTCDLLK